MARRSDIRRKNIADLEAQIATLQAELDRLHRGDGYARGGEITASRRRHDERGAEIARRCAANPRDGAVIAALADEFGISERRVRRILKERKGRPEPTPSPPMAPAPQDGPGADRPAESDRVVDQAPTTLSADLSGGALETLAVLAGMLESTSRTSAAKPHELVDSLRAAAKQIRRILDTSTPR